jgi:very-short-patch-repair endonuclease
MASDPNAHPTCGAMANALACRNLPVVIEQLQLLNQLAEWRKQLQERNASYSRVAKQLPKLAAQVLSTPEDPRWSARFASIADAFKWAQLRWWIDSHTGSESRHKVIDEIRNVEGRILELTGELAAGRAWKSCFDAMSDQHRRSLVQWQQAIAKLGKGTGIYAHKWRRAAQQELSKCKEAIPAWIMPLYRVFETVPPSPGLFDVIIVDEASQCGIDGLGLLFLGKKVIVVGDNEQISPSYVGVNREDVDLILKARLGHMESRQSFDLENSLFDHASRLFDARVTLREHFRCVPDIIRFSNGLSYDNKLVPLRQYPANRLAPLVPKHIPHGTTNGASGRKSNITEADALVEAVVACCKDVAYEGKSMGVISLLGEHQSAYIERQLLRILGPEEMIKRKLICGDAYSFQGDERHVIFMSLVAAPSATGSSRFNALTSRTDKQRFNVAASRAQDQCWLFHSITPGDIGNSECVRKRLLTHFYDPARSIAESDGIDLPSLRRQASSASRPETPPRPFDSWFEVDVYLRIIERGYMARVQYPAGEYRIDIVIEGVTRLAVECDGDKWHGPERFEDDFRRQRQLERVGWQFWRIGGSDFYRSPAESLVGLWARLDDLGIQPVDSLAPASPVGGYIASYQVPMSVPLPVQEVGPSTLAEEDSSFEGTTLENDAKALRPVAPTPSPKRAGDARELPELAEIRALQTQLRELWRNQGKSDKAVPSTKPRLIQLIEEATIFSAGIGGSQPDLP